VADSGTATLMVVDDVPENVRLLEAVLTAPGYDMSSRRAQASRAARSGASGVAVRERAAELERSH
jgi:CheY-like chemotaxis protein